MLKRFHICRRFDICWRFDICCRQPNILTFVIVSPVTNVKTLLMFEHLFLAALNILVCKVSLADKGADFK